jgi:signal peptidase I
MTSSSQGSGTDSNARPDGWLPYEGPHPEGAGTDEADAADRSEDPNVPSVDDGPWLRLEHSEQDGAATNPPRDPAWLETELTPVDRPELTAADAPEDDHDTGVPPTLVGPGEELDPEREARGAAADDTPHHTAPLGEDQDQWRDDQEPDREPDRGSRGTAKEPVGALGVLGAAVKELAIVVGMALVLSFIVKTWLLQAFYIPSGSMEDTLRIDDRVIVSKLTPGPIDLRRGDIVVFADPGDWLEPVVQAPHGTAVTVLRDAMMFVGLLPDNSENHLIKRVIGLPGDHVTCCDEGGRLTVNGVPVKEPYLMPGDAASESQFDITVPRGRVWVMGDHRSDSSDSRFHDAPENNGTQGSVDERLIVGRAVAIVWPLDHLDWLSTPTDTFAKVPNPSPGEDRGGAPLPAGPPSGGGD